MRKFVFVAGLVCLGSALVMAQNQGKVSNGWACAKPTDAKTFNVGDEPGHTYTVAQYKCTSTKGEWAGVREKEGTATEFDEIKGGKLSGHGIFLETFANGDTAKFDYQTSGTIKDGKLGPLGDKWQFVSGTGKLKGAKASGTCSGNGNPDGGSTVACTGTYTLTK